MFPLSYENVISEYSMNVQNVQFLKGFKNVFLVMRTFYNFANIMGTQLNFL